MTHTTTLLKILITLFFLSGLQAIAQTNSIPNSFRSRELAVFPQSVEKGDLVILDEKNEIEIIDDRATYMWWRFNKDVKILIKSPKGVSQLSEVIIPENYDPTYKAHFPPFRNYGYRFSRINLIDYKATVMRQNGDSIPLMNQPVIREDSMLMLEEEYFGLYKSYVFPLQGLEPGDVLHLRYAYEVPAIDNMAYLMSFRIFFHSAWPKLSYSLKLSYHKELFMEMNQLNGALPSLVTMEGKTIVRHWTTDSLTGCLDEAGSHPYKELPHIIFTPKPYDFWYYTVPKSFEPRFIPAYVVMTSFREEWHPAITLSSVQEINTRQYIPIRNFIDEQARGLDRNQQKPAIMERIHHTIVDEFAYTEDYEYITRERLRDPEIGDQVGNRTLTDLARNDLYLALILAQQLNYCTTYLSDHRSGEISDYYFAPMRDNDFLYTVFFGGDTVHWYYPKKSRFGYYQDEIPFYYENTAARLVHLSDYLKKDERMKEEFVKIVFPASPLSYNSRKSHVMVAIDLETGTADFAAKVELSGQFSTMTRGLYLHDYRHPQIDQIYHRRIWDISDGTTLLHHEADIRTKEPPFTTTVTAAYTASDLISQSGDTVRLNLANWFHHVIPEVFDPDLRMTVYHPDFAYKDSYSYLLTFSHPVRLTGHLASVEKAGDPFMMTISMQQLDPFTLKMDSFLSVFNAVSPQEAPALSEVFDMLRELNSSGIVELVLQN